MDAKIKVTTEMAEDAFEFLADNGPKLVHSQLVALAQENAAINNMRAPGSMAGTVKVHDLSERGFTILLVAPGDIAVYGGGTRVAWWTSRGTASQRAMRWFRKVSRAKQRKVIESALVRTARRAGFDVMGGGV